jgi:hypothetical protein
MDGVAFFDWLARFNEGTQQGICPLLVNRRWVISPHILKGKSTYPNK